MRRSSLIWAIVALVALAGTAHAQRSESPGIRVGVGTDITGGVAYGAQLEYVVDNGPNAFELALAFFGGNFEEDSNNGYNDYHEETKVLVVGAMANYLFRYVQRGGPYFVSGVGVGAVSVEWEETSPTDTSLGPPLPGGGSSQSEDGTTAGFVVNFGIGYRLSQTLDLRAQVPTFFFGGGEERDGGVVPTFTLALGLRFH